MSSMANSTTNARRKQHQRQESDRAVSQQGRADPAHRRGVAHIAISRISRNSRVLLGQKLPTTKKNPGG